MRLELRGHHVDITPALRRLVDAKLAKLERLLNDRAVSAQAILTHREAPPPRRHHAARARREVPARRRPTPTTGRRSVGEAIEQISQQAQKIKGKRHDRTRHGVKTGVAAAAENNGARDAGAVASRPGRGARRASACGCRASCAPRARRSGRCRRPTPPGSSTPATAAIVVFRDAETAAISVLVPAAERRAHAGRNRSAERASDR